MQQDNQVEKDLVNDLLIESKERRKLERPKKLQSLIDTQGMRFLEAMDFQSFGNLSSALEQFMAEAPLFQCDASFSAAALSLDLTAQLFPVIDRDKNGLLNRAEFAYLLEQTTAANRQALSWLIENFNAFTQACFFKDQIGKDDIEAARNLFHGLKIVQKEFGFSKQPTLENLQELDEGKISDYLDNNRSLLNPHEISGLKYLLDHIRKHRKSETQNQSDACEDKPERPERFDKKRPFQGMDGVLDRRSLQTLETLRLNSFESLLSAFAAFLTDALSFRGETPFNKSANALDASADILDELEMGEEHVFTPDELLIVSKLSARKDKKRLCWLVNHFEGFTRAFFWPGKAKKKDILCARNIFQGLGFVRERFNCGESVYPEFRQQLRRHIKICVSSPQSALDPGHKASLEDLVNFMERHAR